MNRYSLFILSFFSLINSGAFSLEQNNVVCDPVLEGLPIEESQSTALACNNCQCLIESFSENPLLEQENYRHVLGTVLLSKLKDEVFPELLRKIQSFQEAPAECSLDRLSQVSCSGEKGILELHQSSLNQFLSWDENVSCFPNATIEKAVNLSTNNRNLKTMRQQAMRGGDLSYINDPILKIYHENRNQFSSNSSYQEIKKQVEEGPLKKNLQSFLRDDCNKTYSEVEQVYCQKPKQIHLGASLDEDEQLMGTIVNFGNEQLPAIRYRAVACQERGCLAENNQSDFCQKQQEEKGYSVQELINNEPLYKSNLKRADALSAAAVDYSEFCVLLTCANTEEAVSIIFGEKQACIKQTSPKKTLGDVIGDLNCKKSNPEKPVDDLCTDPHFAALVSVYQEDKDEPRPRLAMPEGKTYDDLSAQERKEILLAADYKPEELKFLGDFGIKRIFNQEVVFTGAKLAPEVVEARQAVQEQAQSVIANNEARAREEASRENQKTVAAQKERKTQRQAMAQQRAQRLSQAQATREQQQRELAQNQPAPYINQPDQAYQSALADLNRDIQKELAKQSGANENRALNRVSEDSTKSLKDLKSKVQELEAQADQIRNEQERSAYEQKIRDLKNEVNDLRNGRNPTERSLANTRSNNRVDNNAKEVGARSALPDDELTPREAAIFAPANARAANEASRAPAIVDEGGSNSRTIASNGEAVSYFERTSEELPFLSIEQLSEVKPGEDFVLGIRDGQQLATVEMSPETIGDKVLYRADFPEDLSFEAKLNMMKSPFFQSYLHPDSMAEVFDPAERARHADLIKLLEFKE